MTTESTEGAHVPFDIVHVSMLAPLPMAVSVDDADVGAPSVPAPDTTVHNPVPIAGVFPARVVEPGATQMFWFGPAVAVVGSGSTVITTSSNTNPQVPLVIVHRKTLAPTGSPLTAELASAGLARVPPPETIVHTPVPDDGTFPASVVLADEIQISWSGPALAGVGKASTKTTMLSELDGQGELEIVHANTFVPAARPVTADEDEVGALMVPAPETSVHRPVPTEGVLAESVEEGLLIQVTWFAPVTEVVGGVTSVTVTVLLIEIDPH